jgi:hypothetical protein
MDLLTPIQIPPQHLVTPDVVLMNIPIFYTGFDGLKTLLPVLREVLLVAVGGAVGNLSTPTTDAIVSLFMTFFTATTASK